MNNIPVIVITYNRPWHTAQVLESLKRHKIQKLFIFSDAPRTSDHLKGVSETRNVIKQIDWTIPEIIERADNLGLAKSIVTAVNYVFERHDRMILLEDDCVPQQYFFDFVNTCLEKYQHNDKIFGITGYALQMPEEVLVSYPYDNCFFPRICSWGWATWKRAWDHHESDTRKLLDVSAEKGIDLSQGGSDIPSYIELLLQERLKDVWTLAWQLSVYLQGGCYVHPTRTHLVNIGMDGSGRHCGTTQKFASRPAVAKPTRFADKIFFDGGIENIFRSFYDIPVAEQGKIERTIHKMKSLAGYFSARRMKRG